jgi:hypothetical protein
MLRNCFRSGVALACLLQLAACAGLPPQVPGPTSTVGAAAIPENDVVQGVNAFKSTFSTSGMAGVGRNVTKCQDAAARHAALDLVRQCLAFEMAALIVSTSHDNRMHTQPLPHMSKTDFTRRFDLYFGEMGVAPASRGTAADDLFRRILPMVQSS